MAARKKPVVDAVELEQQAREYVLAAAQIVKSLGPDRARIAWLLEEAVEYLDDVDAADETSCSDNSRAVYLESKKHAAR